MLNPTNKGIFNATLNAYKILANKEILGFSIMETLKITERKTRYNYIFRHLSQLS